MPSPIQSTFVARVPHPPLPHVTPHVHPAAVPNRAAQLAGKTVSQTNQLQQPQLTSEQKTAQTLHSIKSKAMLPATLEFFGMLGIPLAWIAKKCGFERTQAGIAIATRAPVQALRKTTLADAMRLPANLMKEAGAEAATIRGEANGWTKAMDARSAAWTETAVDLEGTIAKVAKPKLAKLGVGEGLDKFAGTKFGKAVEKKLQGFMGRRHSAALDKHASAIADAEKALTTEKIGFIERMVNKVMGETAGKVEVGALQSVADGLHVGRGLKNSPKKTAHFAGLVNKLETLMRGDTLKGEIKDRAAGVMQHLQKAHFSAKALENGAVAGNGLRAMAMEFGKKLGGVSLFNALLAVGITAGVGAVLVTARGESKEAKAALSKLNNELAGQPASGFLSAVKAAQKSGKHWAAAKTGVRMAGEVAEGAMWMMPHAGMGMMGAMMLPQLCETLVPGNTVLGALEALDKSDKGQLALEPSQRIDLMRKIIGVVPSVAANGGEYNRGSGAMAAEMQERGFKYHDIVQMLGNEAAFNKFANEIADKQQAQQPKIAAVSAEMRAPAANDDAPKTRIAVGASASQHQGKVHNLQRVRA